MDWFFLLSIKKQWNEYDEIRPLPQAKKHITLFTDNIHLTSYIFKIALNLSLPSHLEFIKINLHYLEQIKIISFGIVKFFILCN